MLVPQTCVFLCAWQLPVSPSSVPTPVVFFFSFGMFALVLLSVVPKPYSGATSFVAITYFCGSYFFLFSFMLAEGCWNFPHMVFMKWLIDLFGLSYFVVFCFTPSLTVWWCFSERG